MKTLTQRTRRTPTEFNLEHLKASQRRADRIIHIGFIGIMSLASATGLLVAVNEHRATKSAEGLNRLRENPYDIDDGSLGIFGINMIGRDTTVDYGRIFRSTFGSPVPIIGGLSGIRDFLLDPPITVSPDECPDNAAKLEVHRDAEYFITMEDQFGNDVYVPADELERICPSQ